KLPFDQSLSASSPYSTGTTFMLTNMSLMRCVLLGRSAITPVTVSNTSSSSASVCPSACPVPNSFLALVSVNTMLSGLASAVNASPRSHSKSNMCINDESANAIVSSAYTALPAESRQPDDGNNL